VAANEYLLQELSGKSLTYRVRLKYLMPLKWWM